GPPRAGVATRRERGGASRHRRAAGRARAAAPGRAGTPASGSRRARRGTRSAPRRRSLVEGRVVEAADEDVRRVLEAVRAQKVLCRRGVEPGEWVAALHPVFLEVPGAFAPEDDGAVLAGLHQHPADMRMRGESRQQLRMAGLELLTRQPLVLFHQVDEAEVARAEDHDVAARDVVLRRLLLPSRRLGRGVDDHRVLLVAALERADTAVREVPLHELVEPVAVALPERRPLGLAVVGEDDELVRPRRVAAGALDASELLVELSERL